MSNQQPFQTNQAVGYLSPHLRITSEFYLLGQEVSIIEFLPVLWPPCLLSTYHSEPAMAWQFITNFFLGLYLLHHRVHRQRRVNSKMDPES